MAPLDTVTRSERQFAEMRPRGRGIDSLSLEGNAVKHSPIVVLALGLLALPITAPAEKKPVRETPQAAKPVQAPGSAQIPVLSPDLMISSQEVHRGKWAGGAAVTKDATLTVETFQPPSFWYAATVKNVGGNRVRMNYTLPGKSTIYGVGYDVTATVDGDMAKERKGMGLGWSTGGPSQDVKELPPQGSLSTFPVALEKVSFGTHAICFNVTVDTGHAVTETNEGNNSAQFCFTAVIKQAKPAVSGAASKQGVTLPLIDPGPR